LIRTGLTLSSLRDPFAPKDTAGNGSLSTRMTVAAVLSPRTAFTGMPMTTSIVSSGSLISSSIRWNVIPAFLLPALITTGLGVLRR